MYSDVVKVSNVCEDSDATFHIGVSRQKFNVEYQDRAIIIDDSLPMRPGGNNVHTNTWVDSKSFVKTWGINSIIEDWVPM